MMPANFLAGPTRMDRFFPTPGLSNWLDEEM
jgi:hypothetical protein